MLLVIVASFVGIQRLKTYHHRKHSIMMNFPPHFLAFSLKHIASKRINKIYSTWSQSLHLLKTFNFIYDFLGFLIFD